MSNPPNQPEPFDAEREELAILREDLGRSNRSQWVQLAVALVIGIVLGGGAIYAIATGDQAERELKELRVRSEERTATSRTRASIAVAALASTRDFAKLAKNLGCAQAPSAQCDTLRAKTAELIDAITSLVERDDAGTR